jgi:hypothetical protein
MNIEKNREKISQDLGLKYESQDWGIINANYKRVKDFINYYQKFNHPIYLKYDLLELIIASFNDYELSEFKDKKIEMIFCNFLKKVCTEINLNTYNPFQYWIDITNEREFPVGKRISNIILPFTRTMSS